MPITQETGGAAESGFAAGLGKVAGRISQQQYEKEVMDYSSQLKLESEKQRLAYMAQLDIESEIRAIAWEDEKMRRRSELDFELEETAYLRKTQRIDTQIERLNKEKEEGRFSGKEWQYQALMEHYLAQKTGVPSPSPTMFIPENTKGFGVAPWYTSPEWKETPEGKQAMEKAFKQRDTFTEYNIQKGLGILATGAPESALGIPLPVLKSKAEHENWALKNWGPNWKELVPEAEELINKKFGLPVPISKGATKPLDRSVVEQYLIANGNNVQKAMAAAKRDGYQVE